MALTPSQQQAATTLSTPLFIQAGAGTGKTHTLTQRLVYAFSPESGAEGKPFLTDAEQFVTITFTSKAAGELLGRIRSALRSNGLEDAALEIDSAWISTIHGMCKRVLVEHALDTGTDASAGFLDESQQKYYQSLALDQMLEAHLEDETLQELFATYEHKNVISIIKALLGSVLTEDNGFSHIDLGPEVLPSSNPTDASPLVMALQQGLEEVCDSAEDLIRNGNKNKGPGNLKEYCETQLAELQGTPRSLEHVYGYALNLAAPVVRGDALAEAMDMLREILSTFISDAMLAKQRIDLAAFLGYAREVAQAYSEFKRKHSLMDNDELLARAFALLAEDASIAKAYQDQFKLVMVDEFQDTDRLQIGIIDNLTSDTLSNLATVGDRQQSIYRFRGADVTVYNEQRAKMTEKGGVSVNLDSNFRSHDQILRCVDTLFGQNTVFGDALLSLQHGRREEAPLIAEGEPRVRLLLAASGVVDNENAGTGTQALRRDMAQMISKQFAELRDKQGCKPSDMVILLGKMTNVSLYLDALQAEGFEARVSGGSTYYTSAEIHILIQYLRALSNPFDSPAVLAVLRSPLYSLSDTELLSACGDTEPYKGLLASGEPSIAHAAKQFTTALKLAGQMPVAQLLSREVERSGWATALSGQGAKGTMVLANIHKFIRLVHEFEAQRGVGLVSVTAYFGDFLAQVEAGLSLKESPGVLQEDLSNAVQIMTIHASKGLEFPIVAVAEFEDKKPSEQRCYVAQDNKGMFPSIKVCPVCDAARTNSDSAWRTYYRERLSDLSRNVTQPSDALTAGALYSFIRRDAAEQDEAEAKRLFYVACTRARDVLIIATHDKNLPHTSDKPYALRERVVGDIETAFFGSEGFPNGPTSMTSMFEFGSEDARYKGLYEFNVHEDTQFDDSAASTSGHSGFKEDVTDDAGENPGVSALPRIGEGPLTLPVIDLTHLQNNQVSSAPVQKAARLQSYSSIAAARHTDGVIAEKEGNSNATDVAEPQKDWRVLRGTSAADATDFGSAFHLAAERWLLHTCESLASEASRAARIFKLNTDCDARLEKALLRWTESKRARELKAYPVVYAEYPFVVSVEGSVPLQGAIDALGVDVANKKALICDYKTSETEVHEADTLRERHQFQASCYAYAIFKSYSASEIEEVELAFVRPEHEADGQMEEVVYHFKREDTETLLREILA